MNIKKIRVNNMTSANGREIPNQFEIHTIEGVYFQSYKSIIAFIPFSENLKTQIGKDWEYSTTTGKYRNIFLDEDKKTTQKKLDSGEYELNNDL